MKNKVDKKPLIIDAMDCFKYVLEHIDNDIWDLIVDNVSAYFDEVFKDELPITDDEQDILQEQLVDYCFDKIYSLKEEKNEDENVYTLTNEDGQELKIKIDEVLDYLTEKLYGWRNYDWTDVNRAVEMYLYERPKMTAENFTYLVKSGQVAKLTDRFYTICDK